VLFLGGLGDGLGYFLFCHARIARVDRPRVLWRTHLGTQGALAYLAVCLFVYGFVYYGQFRYQIPMEPLMILVATPLIVSVWTRREALLRN
jgi:hypothetical protein